MEHSRFTGSRHRIWYHWEVRQCVILPTAFVIFHIFYIRQKAQKSEVVNPRLLSCRPVDNDMLGASVHMQARLPGRTGSLPALPFPGTALQKLVFLISSISPCGSSPQRVSTAES